VGFIRECDAAMFILICALCSMAILARVSRADGAEHIMSPSALRFDEPAPESAAAAMSHGEYGRAIAGLKRLMDGLYRDAASALSGEALAALEKSQEAWLDFAEKYDRALGNTLDARIKIFYGVSGKERFTNVRRESVMAIYRHRILDLRGAAGGGPKIPAAATASPERRMAEFDARFGGVVYPTPEKYRPGEYEWAKAWRRFRDAHEVFLCKFYGDGAPEARNEMDLAYRRILGLMETQEEGLRFFRHEREE
jgi:hypothetical protein